jgi:hypothetical protein
MLCEIGPTITNIDCHLIKPGFFKIEQYHTNRITFSTLADERTEDSGAISVSREIKQNFEKTYKSNFLATSA